MEFSSGAWLTSSKENEDLLSSIQFRAAKIIMKTKVNMSKAALLIELGWEPIDSLVRNQYNVSEWSDMSTCGLLIK